MLIDLIMNRAVKCIITTTLGIFNIRNHYCLGNVLQRLNDFNYKVGENKPVHIFIYKTKKGKHIDGFRIWE